MTNGFLFDSLPGGHHETIDRPKPKARTNVEGVKSYNGTTRNYDDLDDGLSDALSVNSDPVFRWLKDAV